MDETAIERIHRAQEAIKKFIDLLDMSEKQNCELIDLLRSMDDEQQDILHEFELDKFYRTEGHRKARRLQNIRRIRRGVKDTIALWLPVKEFAKSHKKLKTELKDVINEIDHIVYEQQHRIYKPRINMTSCIAGRHYECQKIDLKKKLEEVKEFKKEHQKKS